jgi:hypothetical protein
VIGTYQEISVRTSLLDEGVCPPKRNITVIIIEMIMKFETSAILLKSVPILFTFLIIKLHTRLTITSWIKLVAQYTITPKFSRTYKGFLFSTS